MQEGFTSGFSCCCLNALADLIIDAKKKMVLVFLTYLCFLMLPIEFSFGVSRLISITVATFFNQQGKLCYVWSKEEPFSESSDAQGRLILW